MTQKHGEEKGRVGWEESIWENEELNGGGMLWDLRIPAISLSSSGRDPSELLKGKRQPFLCLNEPWPEITGKKSVWPQL